MEFNFKEKISMTPSVFFQMGICKMALPVTSGLIFKNAHEILYFQADNVYSICHFKDGSRKSILSPLLSLEQIFDKHFVRIHKKYLINKSEIIEYKKQDGGCILLSNGEMLPLSKMRKKIFFQSLSSTQANR